MTQVHKGVLTTNLLKLSPTGWAFRLLPDSSLYEQSFCKYTALIYFKNQSVPLFLVQGTHQKKQKTSMHKSNILSHPQPLLQRGWRWKLHLVKNKGLTIKLQKNCAVLDALTLSLLLHHFHSSTSDTSNSGNILNSSPLSNLIISHQQQLSLHQATSKPLYQYQQRA